MDKCNLCKKNDADKKGSHIVPHFLLRRIENIDGKTDRDYEIGYKIQSFKSEFYFGRSVQPERLEETFGEITDDDIENNKHPLVVDYFLCSGCEKRLAQIESKYSETIGTIDNNEYESGVSNANGILFWASIFWRMSVHGQSGVKLTAEQNELLRLVLDLFLPGENEKFDEKLISESDLVKKLSYKIIRCHNCVQDEAKWLLFHPDFYNSFCLFIDEFVIAFSINEQYDELKTIDCFGVNDLILSSPTNSIGGNEVIKPFDRSIFIEISKRIMNTIKDVYLDGLDEFFDKAHVAAGGEGDKMPAELKQKILEEITSDEKKIGRKYTQEEIIKRTYVVMKKYAL